MIRSFSDAVLESFYYEGAGSAARWIPSGIHSSLKRKLDQLNSAKALTDLKAPPKNRLEALKGDLAGFYSIRVNDQWRLVFRWFENTPHDVKLMDYH